ncbi:receptor like protein 7 [Artemisia annua]|uniref:Receptor like protein 7 n=1 Tax=Artemisia annua TaxID=35608 RepID=A0A2U1Q1W0_ARTAN|nr:receptor like protein 7 [Artemisia annua]
MIPSTYFQDRQSLISVDLRFNGFDGSIPSSLFSQPKLLKLQLSNNNFDGVIPHISTASESLLNILDLSSNKLDGEIPKSFFKLRFLNILLLSSNNLSGFMWYGLFSVITFAAISCQFARSLIIVVVSLAAKRFGYRQKALPSSTIQTIFLTRDSRKALGETSPLPIFYRGDPSSKNHTSFKVMQLSDLCYQDSVTVTVKGFELELVKILIFFTSIDISSNPFLGVIPETIGQLKALYLLNVSHNEFTGTIPPAIGHLSHLESLDMSLNKITGEIRSVLTSLPFLSVFNLLYNQLEGKIPTGSQFQTFSQTSYLANKGLCGFPLNPICTSTAVPVPSSSPNSDTSGDGNDWQIILYIWNGSWSRIINCCSGFLYSIQG